MLSFLRKYGLDKDFKMSIEANHATLAGHTFQHELRVARDNGVFGSIDANQGDMLLGWDTDQFPTDLYSTTMCMYEVLKNGGFTNGGLNFDAKARRASNTYEDIFQSYIAGMELSHTALSLPIKSFQTVLWIISSKTDIAHTPRASVKELLTGKPLLRSLNSIR